MSSKIALPIVAAFLTLILPFAYAQGPVNSSTAPESGRAEASSSASTPEPDLRSEVEQLRQLVQAQQKRIDALEGERKSSAQPEAAATGSAPASSQNPESVAASSPAATPVPASAPTTTALSPVAAQTAADISLNSPAPAPSGQNPEAPPNVTAGSTDERIRNLERQIKGLGPISFSGDVRLRGEPFFGGPSNGSLDRFRGRVRARFNAIAELGSQFTTGITLASGDVNNPTSTNQDLTGFYSRKPIALDQAFVEFTPNKFKELTLIGGKFRYPWYNTELTWDKDLNPEGAAETLAFKLDTPVLKRIAFIGFQLPFAQVAGTSTTDQRINQQVTYGGQIQTAWQIIPHVTLGAYSGFYDFVGADSIAYALARASGSNPQTPWVGLLPLASGSTLENSVYTTTSKTIITVGGTAYPTGVTSVTRSQFASKFALFDNLATLDIDTGHARWPIGFVGDYVQNTEACDNLANIVAAPTNTATATYKQTVSAPCVSNQRRGYWAEGRVGRLQEKGDMQFGYTRIYIEREAVLGNFNYSELRAASNVTEHRFDAYYQFDRSVQLGFTALVGRPLASTEPWLTRLQFDTIYIF